MAKSKKRRDKKRPSKQGQQAAPSAKDQEVRIRSFDRIPLWGWILIFLLPLIASEFMFYRMGRWPSVIIFPLAWIGFWAAMMHRSGWRILKKRKDE
ncbi:MAG: hypothetical protein FJ014_00595 [Chloroflexi bacterium]|nr:hypothetical protein [Chloroflexota bacterium]